MRTLNICRAAAACVVILAATACAPIGNAIERANRLKPDYYASVVTGGPLEQRYTGLGDSETDAYAFSESGVQYKVWFPATLAQRDAPVPAIIMSNGSGIRFPAYEATFQHLASWGFVVIGDNVDSTATGQSVSMMVDRLRALNARPGVFQNRIDLQRIGVSGHSQGAVGAVNAITRGANGGHFSSAYLASMTSPQIIENMEWTAWRYDASRIRVPVFIVAGTGKVDSDVISPLASMLDVFDGLEGNGTTVLARRKDTDHGQMLVNADGYMTAWFRYTLLDDARAGDVFVGADPELKTNTRNWQDVRSK